MSALYGKALTDFAELRLHQQRYEGALQLADTAIEVQPRNASAWIHRSRALRHLGRDAHALESIDRALLIDPTNHDAQQLRLHLTGG